LAQEAYAIETYHRALKRCCAGEMQARSAVKRRTTSCFRYDICPSAGSKTLETGKSWYHRAGNIIRDAVKALLQHAGFTWQQPRGEISRAREIFSADI